MTAFKPRPRLLIYSQDGLGLGHLRRTTLLATDFLAARPGASALTISDSPIGQFFDTAPGHDYLKLPSIRKVGPGNWSPVSLSMPFDDVLSLRRRLIRSAALDFAPDVLLVDHMPHGAMGELLLTLEALEGLPVRVVLGLRDILDAPATVRRRWRLEGAFAAVDQYFDDILVYGSRDVFDVAEQYSWPRTVSERLRYCGYICSAGSPSSVQAVRQRYLADEPDGELIVAMAGGGADASQLFSTLMAGLPAVLTERKVTAVIITGPFLPDAERNKLRRLSEGLPVHVVDTVGDSVGYLGAADLVVGMAGYNTTAEILSVAARAVLVPRAGPSAEQRMRASRFAGKGWVDWLPPETLSPGLLARTMVNALATPVVTHEVPPDLDGRNRAVRHLLAGVDGMLPNVIDDRLAELADPGPPLVRQRELLGER